MKEEGAEDTHVYGKFTYWCEETTKEKNKLIKESKETIDVSTSTIEALEADIETLKMEIAKLTAEIEEMEEARTNATKIREAEHAVYMKSKTELDETIQSIKDCITAMKEGMEGGFLQAKTLIEARPLAAETLHVLSVENLSDFYWNCRTSQIVSGSQCNFRRRKAFGHISLDLAENN